MYRPGTGPHSAAAKDVASVHSAARYGVLEDVVIDEGGRETPPPLPRMRRQGKFHGTSPQEDIASVQRDRMADRPLGTLPREGGARHGPAVSDEVARCWRGCCGDDVRSGRGSTML